MSAGTWHNPNGFLLFLYLISRTSGKNELAVWVEAQTVDFSSVSIYCVAGFGCVIGPCVPSGGGYRRVRRRQGQSIHSLSIWIQSTALFQNCKTTSKQNKALNKRIQRWFWLLLIDTVESSEKLISWDLHTQKSLEFLLSMDPKTEQLQWAAVLGWWELTMYIQPLIRHRFPSSNDFL